MLVKNNSRVNRYIQKITFDGKPYDKSYKMHQDITRGGSLIIEMGDKPSATWGVSLKDRPYSIPKF